MVIKSGTPTIVGAGIAAMGLAVAETTPNQISAQNVIGNILNEFADAAQIVYVPSTGEIHASSEAGPKAALSGFVNSAGVTTHLFLNPDADQTGRSLSWTAAAGNDLAGISFADLVTAVKPKFTVEALVARMLAKIQEREAAVPASAGTYGIWIDQVNKQVGIFSTEESWEDLGTSVAVVANDETVKVSLTPEDEDVVTSALPFEGGAV